MILNRWALVTAVMLAVQPVCADELFVIKDIQVEGIQRTEAGTVFNYLPIKVGEVLTDEKTAAAIKALYATGFFKDVRLEARDGVVIVTVEERQSIAKITITGTKEFTEEDLKAGLKQVGLADGRVLDRALLDKAEQELKRQYFNRGKYAVEIKTTLTPLDRNRVAVQFDVIEGDTAKIRQINIVGNKAFTEKELLKEFSSTTPGWLTWYTKTDQYSKSRLGGDIESLRSFYLNHGYLEFNVDSTQVLISPDKLNVYITVNVTEGRQYKVSEVRLAGQMLVPEEQLQKLVSIVPGEVFARDKLTETTKKIGDRLGNDGYAFANVNAVPDLNKENATVAFTLFIDPGRRVYVNRVNISGNSKTEDEVIRREIRQMESAYYDAEQINRSRERLNRLGYFSEVNIETPGVPGTTDQVDVNVAVTEKSTGNMMLGAGFSSTDGFVLSGSVSQNNLFGTGNRLALQINSGSVNTVYSLSYTNPYFTLDGVSLGYDIYRRDVDAQDQTDIGAYQTSTKGTGFRFGFPVNERDFISTGVTYEKTSVTTFLDSPLQYKLFVAEFGETNTTLLLSGAWARDTRNNFLFPTSGMMQKFAAEWATPLADLQYYKLSYQLQNYFPLPHDFSLLLNGEVGYGAGLNDKPLPFFKNFYAGGVNSVRGYKAGTIGPKDLLGDAIGGNQRYVANAELFFPVPGLKDDKSVRMSVFADMGAVFGPYGVTGEYSSFTMDGFRYSAGVSALWVSPLGPLKFSLAQAINPGPADETEVFQFTFGNTF